MEKKRKYSEDYLKFGFTTLFSNGTEKPQCILCNAVLSTEPMTPSKLKRHLETKHSEHTKKELEFFRCHKTGLRRQKIDPTGNFQQQSTAVQASYEIALEIAKQKNLTRLQERISNPAC